MHRFALILACLASACQAMRQRASGRQVEDSEFENSQRQSLGLSSREARHAPSALHPSNSLSAFLHALSPAVAFGQSYLPMRMSEVPGLRPVHVERQGLNPIERQNPVMLVRESIVESAARRPPEHHQPGYKRALLKRLVTQRSEPGYKRALARRLVSSVFRPQRTTQTNMMTSAGMGNSSVFRPQRTTQTNMMTTAGMGNQFLDRSDRSEERRKSRLTRRVDGAVWPEQGRSHRFIKEDDPSFEEYLVNCATGYVCNTPDRFQGLRTDGVVQGSSRVQFTLPREGSRPKTMELLRSRENDNPSFGAVKVKMPVDATVTFKESRVFVKNVKKESNAESAMIRSGDIIRAVSVPDNTDGQEDTPWWARMGQPALPASEEGMVILDGRPAAEYYAALQENVRLNGKEAEVVLIIERPVDADSNSDKGGFGGFFGDDDGKKKRFFSSLLNQPEPVPDLVAIPIPVEDDAPPGYRRSKTSRPPRRR